MQFLVLFICEIFFNIEDDDQKTINQEYYTYLFLPEV